MATENILAQIAPPFRMFRGPDFLLSTTQYPVLGITAILQNPFNLRLPITVEFLSASIERLHDRLMFDLEPLAIVKLSLPLAARRGDRVKFRLASKTDLRYAEYAAQLVRPKGGGGVDLRKTVLMNATGLASAIVGVGKVGTVRRGGDVGNPFTHELEVKEDPTSSPDLLRLLAGSLETIWAPPHARPVNLRHVVQDHPRIMGPVDVMRDRAGGEADGEDLN